MRAHEQHVRQFAVHELLEQAGRIAGQAPGRQHGEVPIGGFLDPQDEVLTGTGQHDAAHEKAFP